MTTINDYVNPEDAIRELELKIGGYTGAPYVVATDSCTHAIELCLRFLKIDHEITIPECTYLSVPMTLSKLGIPYKVQHDNWVGEYSLGGTLIYDSARLFAPNMYLPTTFKCLSFGHSKPLAIGRGGAILLDNEIAYQWLKRASYDGRDMSYFKWDEQKYFQQGYHYMMRPEEAVKGLNLINENQIDNKLIGASVYPSIRNIKIL